MSLENNSTITKGLAGLCLLLAAGLVYALGPQVGLPFGPSSPSAWPSGAEISMAEAKQAALAYINDQLLQGQAQAKIEGDVSEESGLYKFKVAVAGQTLTSYITKDGVLLFPQGYTLQKAPDSATESDSNSNQGIAQRERPDVKIFVMSYCPYGLQAIKGFLPVYDLLRDKADMGIYFVDYAMHGKKEIDENLFQYCLQQQQPDRLSPYLKCFVKTADSQQCQAQAGVDTEMIEACVASTDTELGITDNFNDKTTWINGRFPKFDVHATLNDQYGVRGSPTLVVNDKVVSSGRSPSAFLDTVCSGFIEPPSECAQQLSKATPAPGFGGGTSDSSGAQCE